MAFQSCYQVIFRPERHNFDFRDANWDVINGELAGIDWVGGFGNGEGNLCWNYFCDTLESFLIKYLPIHSAAVKNKSGSKPVSYPYYIRKIQSAKISLWRR